MSIKRRIKLIGLPTLRRKDVINPVEETNLISKMIRKQFLNVFNLPEQNKSIRLRF